MADAGPLMGTVAKVRSTSSGERVSVGEVIQTLDEKGVLPAIFIPALVAATPLSGIPGVSAVCGLLIALLSFELIAGFRRLMLPKALKSRSMDAARLRTAIQRIEPVLAWLDRHSENRLSFLFHRPFIWVPQVLCLVSGMAMPFLEFIPFSGSIAAIGVCLLVIAMLTEDGLFFIIALLPYAVAVYLLASVLM